jgi:L-cysteine:1D-myo-inositol 2-amino-2-deoxy-alpha-D-glucopyranoside ligase
MPDLGLPQMLELSAERGGDPDRTGKKDPLDVIVWRAERPGEPSWDSRFGRGRPGWHVECAAIATSHLGPVFDVQAGGFDLVFPHHEMSASHTRVAFAGHPGHKFARLYAHAGMVGLGGEKMSKSLGNLVFVSRLIGDGEDPMADRLARWRSAASAAQDGLAPHGTARATLAQMRERLADDLDAPGALAAVDQWATEILAERTWDDPPSPPADRAEGHLVRDAVDALLGVAL